MLDKFSIPVKTRKCIACGKAIKTKYTYCALCYLRNTNRLHADPRTVKCRECGAIIGDRYIYCYTCAKNKKLVN